MKTKKISRKLVLKKTTVANLNGASMGRVYGGTDIDDTIKCLTPISCDTCNTCVTCNNCTETCNCTVWATCGGERTCDTFCCSDVLCPG